MGATLCLRWCGGGRGGLRAVRASAWGLMSKGGCYARAPCCPPALRMLAPSNLPCLLCQPPLPSNFSCQVYDVKELEDEFLEEDTYAVRDGRRRDTPVGKGTGAAAGE